MEDPPIPIHPHLNPNKRMLAGSSSSSTSVDPDVIEIPPPVTWNSKRPKQKSIINHEVIVVDDDDDDIMIIDEKVGPNSKGKKPMLNHLQIHNWHNVSSKNGLPLPKANGFMNGNLSSHVSDVGDDIAGMDVDVIYDEECAKLQAHFDDMDIPAGIEAAVPWWPTDEHAVSSSLSSMFGMEAYSSIGNSKVHQAQSWSYYEPSQAKAFESKSKRHKLKTPSYGGQPNSDLPMQSSVVPPLWPLPHPHPHFHPHNHKNSATLGNSYKVPSFGATNNFGWPNELLGNANPFIPMTPAASASAFSPYNNLVINNHSTQLDDKIVAEISPPPNDGEGGTSESCILKKLELFHRFDPVEDHSDHHYNNIRESCNPPKTWKKKIFAEWDMLKKDLPDTIFVRIYESRMDLLRAVIMGADGTPYHDGLFFFDVYFDPLYPSAPPKVNYRSHGLRINPNLYNCGKVCLSLLGTWSGSGDENWRPGKSNMLQVLVSIQGLILNAEPYYNEPGFASSKNSSHGKKRSKDYSEDTFILSLKTMLYTMRNPPKHFEDLVYGHFFKRAHEILSACRAYLNGVEVGSFDKGKTVDSQKKRQTCSQKLKTSLPGYINSLVQAFTKIGVKDCEKFLVPADEEATQHNQYVVPSSKY